MYDYNHAKSLRKHKRENIRLEKRQRAAINYNTMFIVGMLCLAVSLKIQRKQYLLKTKVVIRYGCKIKRSTGIFVSRSCRDFKY